MQERINAALDRARRIAERDGVHVSTVDLYLDVELAKAMLSAGLVRIANGAQLDPHHLICRVVA